MPNFKDEPIIGEIIDGEVVAPVDGEGELIVEG